MFRSLTSILCLLGVSAHAQGAQWFTPKDFDLTCPIFKKCEVEKKCEPYADELTIRHNPSEGPTFFELPGNLVSTGVLGVIASKEGQTVMASASPDGRQYFRMIVFPTGAITVAKLSLIDNTEDTIFYGNCKQVVG